jgi:probable F420-dependent oxidoreductase
LDWWLNLGFLPFEQLVPLAQAAERAGLTGVSLPDHLVFPEQRDSAYPYSADGSVTWPGEAPWPDPWVAIAAMAQATTHLQLGTGVQILPLREPLALAKAISTAWHLCGERVWCGFGAGWLKEEFDAAGIDFKQRGPRMNEMLKILPRLWSGEPTEFRGAHFEFDALRMSPAAPGIPILIGGNTRAAMWRALRHDGWIGAYTTLEEARTMLAGLRALREEGGRVDRDFRVWLTGARPDAAATEELSSLGVDAFVAPAVALCRSSRLEDREAAIEAFVADTR